MLKGIPPILSPELMRIMLEMGHGDELVLADGNFPAASCAQRLVRSDGHCIPELLNAILQFFPLDQYVEHPVGLMAVVPGDPIKPTIWEEYKTLVKKYDVEAKEFEWFERFEFYERAKQAYAIIATSEKTLYANIILKKGIISD